MSKIPRPYVTLWSAGSPTATVGGTSTIIIGTYVKINVPGRIAGIRFYRDTNDGSNHYGWIAEDTTTRSIQMASFKRITPATSQPPGWVTAFLHPMYRITSGNTYIVGVSFPAGRYRQMVDAHGSDTDTTVGNLVIPHDTVARPNSGSTNVIPLTLPTSMGAAKAAIDLYFLPD